MTSKALTAEVLDVAQIYIDSAFSLQETADRTGLSLREINEVVSHPQAKQYINEVYLDTGYRNRARLGALLDKLIESKIEEAEESEQWTTMDLAELIKLQHKMRIDEAKLETPNTQVNIANFGDSKYAELVGKLVNGNGS